jgi:large subunit ribosomal protein L16
MKGLATRGADISFGEFGLKAVGRGYLSSNQIEAARRAVSSDLKRKGRLWIRVFPDKPITHRAPGQRMGSGKGDIDHYAVVVKPGRIILEIAGVPQEAALSAITKAAAKLPFQTRFVVK